MKKEASKVAAERQLLELLKRVLPKATSDAQLADKIYDAVEQELKRKERTTAFERFCSRMEVPSLEPKSLDDAKMQLAAAFGDADITMKPNRKEKTLAVELALPDGAQFTGEIRVNPDAKPDDGEQEVVLKFVPFPVCLPGDKELVWMLAKRENLGPDEAGIALSKLEEDFWGSKQGQKLLRDRVERTFPEFIARVPGGMLTEAGLKRHYKLPEPVKMLRAPRT